MSQSPPTASHFDTAIFAILTSARAALSDGEYGELLRRIATTTPVAPEPDTTALIQRTVTSWRAAWAEYAGSQAAISEDAARDLVSRLTEQLAPLLDGPPASDRLGETSPSRGLRELMAGIPAAESFFRGK